MYEVTTKLSLSSSKLGQILHLGIKIGPQRGETLDQFLGIGEPLGQNTKCTPSRPKAISW